LSFVAQVPLLDGTLVTFDTNEPTATASWPYRLLLSLAILMIAVVIVSLVAVRWPHARLNALADAAEALGKNIDHAPLTEKGPVEVVRAARAFNTMQARLQRYISDRTRVLAAMSHDLKTPITRLRLRSELLDDGPLRDKFGGDLQEMESMVSATLDFMRGLENGEPLRPVDIMAILESLQADMREMGESVTIAGMVKQPYPAKPQAFKRCLSNLVDNAIKYGKSAAITVNDHVDRVEIRIRDEGPGIPQSELDKVLEPFYRVETSRNRQTGGTGLGLTIARSIVENHGGRLTLRNHAQGGLELELIWPRSIRTSYATAKPSTPRRR
jgi:signal transduction histidine kinase